MKTIQNEAKDGDVIDIQPKNLGTTELYPNVIFIINTQRLKKKEWFQYH